MDRKFVETKVVDGVEFDVYEINTGTQIAHEEIRKVSQEELDLLDFEQAKASRISTLREKLQLGVITEPEKQELIGLLGY